jgi:dipeptidyl aminopeptidase/acylaminoacyl peptidase
MTQPTRTSQFFNRARHGAVARMLALAPLALGAACSSETVAPPPYTTTFSLVAYTTRVANQAALFVRQWPDTTTARLHLANVVDQIPGNYSGLIVDDAHLIALESPSWNPEGTRVAVVATVAYDQSEIVVMGASGIGADVASPNTQIIASDPQWSTDGKKIAYTMSTLPGFLGIDLFVTDLTTHTVRRLTTGKNVVNAAIRWSSDGSAIYYARTAGATTSGPDNWLSEVVRVDVATGAAQSVATNIVGQIVAISRSGGRVLLTRSLGATHALYEATLGAGERQLLATNAAYARYVSTTDSRILIVSSTGPDARAFEILDVASNKRTPVTGVPADASVAVADVVLLPIDDGT